MKILRALLVAVSMATTGCAALLVQTPIEEETAQNGKRAEVAILRGDDLLRGGDIDRALFEYVRALQWDPTKVEAHYRVGNIHSYKGNVDLAEVAYRKVLERTDKHAGALEGLGLIQLRKKNHQEAERLLLQAVTSDPKRWRAHNGLGVLADIRHDYAGAEAHYQTALIERPGLPMLLTNLGYSKYAAGEWNTAQSYFEQAVTKDPRYAKGWSNLGLLHVRKGHYNKAMGAFSNIMSESQASNSIGYLCMVEGKYGQAEQYFLEAIKQSPTFNEAAFRNLEKARALANYTQSKSTRKTEQPLECKP